jgi:hypothetical protein
MTGMVPDLRIGFVQEQGAQRKNVFQLNRGYMEAHIFAGVNITLMGKCFPKSRIACS